MVGLPKLGAPPKLGGDPKPPGEVDPKLGAAPNAGFWKLAAAPKPVVPTDCVPPLNGPEVLPKPLPNEL